MEPHESRQGHQLRLKLTALGRLGEALGEHEGKTVFVHGAIPGEEVLADVVWEHRRYIAARASEVVEASPHRVEAPCPYFGACSGCQWQHIRYERQLELKRALVADALQRVGGISDAPVAPTLAAPEPLGYRNHARFTVGPEGVLGFVNRASRRFVPVDRCLLMHPWINHVLEGLQGRCGETTQVSVRYGVNAGSWLIQPTLQSPDIPLNSGQKAHEEVLGGRRFRITASSFFQVNTAQAERMVDLIRDRLNLTGDELLVDAYAGVGTFAALLAPFARRVIAIEESASAIKDALVNLQDDPRVELRQGKAEDMLEKLDVATDAVILDPPRTGCHPRVLAALARLAPRRVVYVSCDPATLARDLKTLCAGPFHLEEVQPVDMFPQTHHVEGVATLSLDRERARDGERGHRLVLASESPRRREILASAGLEFQVTPSPAQEGQIEGPNPEAVAQMRALAKARAVAAGLTRGIVIGADTVVVHEGERMDKPRGAEEARGMLRRLRDGQHQVVTGVAAVDAATGETAAGVRATEVWMRAYGDEEIEAYLASGEAWDKAGGYAVQDPHLRPAARVWGCYLNVVGLPVCILRELLEALGARLPLREQWGPPGDCPGCHRIAEGQGSALWTS